MATRTGGFIQFLIDAKTLSGGRLIVIRTHGIAQRQRGLMGEIEDLPSRRF